jgi:hypothetical protein
MGRLSADQIRDCVPAYFLTGYSYEDRGLGTNEIRNPGRSYQCDRIHSI